ncbi:DUF1883 domain-containing protein [Bacillus seohaeanensis]|jgi:hypothetical protein|uniref:DUF1883 domain-containing protein n=1 Tax=Bacillus seohaeanensis TaxID=284580 RepID=A0ABW5RLD1_9BACI
MDYIHAHKFLNAGDIVRVTLDRQANVLLLNDINHSNYRCGKGFEYYGGPATKTPFDIGVPYSGHWHVVIDLGGAAGQLRYNIEVI